MCEVKNCGRKEFFENPYKKNDNNCQNKKIIKIDEKGMMIDEILYKNAKLVKYYDYYYIVSDKAVFTITTTPFCNAKCSFCYNKITYVPKGDYIDPDSLEFNNALKFCRAAKIKMVSISGGEPTLCPTTLIKLVEKCNEQFEFSRLHTNGSKLLENVEYEGQCRPLWEFLREKKLSEITISLAHYNEEKNRKIMGIKVNVNQILKEIASNIPIRLSCYMEKDGIEGNEILKYIHFGSERGVNSFIFRFSTDIPEEYALKSEEARSNYNAKSNIEYYRRMLEDNGFKLKLISKKTDSYIIILEKDYIQIVLSKSGEEPDLDKKIRRILYMPDNKIYTSWIADDSVLNFSTSNFNGLIDMHVHSTVSDGEKAPSEVVDLAATKGIKTIIFTEHNAVHDNFTKLKEYANEQGVNIPFPGVEVNTVYVENGSPLLIFHLLVYGQGVMDEKFQKWIATPNEIQNNYILSLYKELKKRELISKDFSDITQKYFDPKTCSTKKQYTRKVLAEEMASNLEIDVEEVKRRYLPQMDYMDKYKNWIDIKEVIKRSKELNCVTILAHPQWIREYSPNNKIGEDKLLEVIVELYNSGLNGVEVNHRLNSKDFRMRLKSISEKYEKIMTGGSDFHGKRRCHLGIHYTEEEEYKKVVECLNTNKNDAKEA